MILALLWGQSGCVTAFALGELFDTRDEAAQSWGVEDRRPPSTAWFWGRVGLAGLVVPFTFSADLVLGLCFGWLIYDEDDEDEDCVPPEELERRDRARERDQRRR